MIPFPSAFLKSGLDPDYIAYMDRHDTLPSTTIQTATNTLIKGLKADGIWDNLDILILAANNTRNNRLLNVKGDYWNAREIEGTTTLITSWTNGNAGREYETLTVTDVNNIACVNTTGNGSCYTNNVGGATMPTTAVVFKFYYTLTINSGSAPRIMLRTAAGGFDSGSNNLNGTYILQAGTNVVEFSPSLTTSSAMYFNLYSPTGADFTITNMKLVVATAANTNGFYGNTNSGRWIFGSNFNPTVDTTSKFMTSTYQTLGVFSNPVGAYTAYDMGATNNGVLCRNSSGNMQATIGAVTETTTLSNNLAGLYSAKRLAAGNVPTYAYQRGTLVGTSSNSSVHSHSNLEFYYTGVNNGAMNGSNRIGRAYYVGGNINVPQLDSRLNTYFASKGLNY